MLQSMRSRRVRQDRVTEQQHGDTKESYLMSSGDECGLGQFVVQNIAKMGRLTGQDGLHGDYKSKI